MVAVEKLEHAGVLQMKYSGVIKLLNPKGFSYTSERTSEGKTYLTVDKKLAVKMGSLLGKRKNIAALRTLFYCLALLGLDDGPTGCRLVVILDSKYTEGGQDQVRRDDCFYMHRNLLEAGRPFLIQGGKHELIPFLKTVRLKGMPKHISYLVSPEMAHRGLGKQGRQRGCSRKADKDHCICQRYYSDGYVGELRERCAMLRAGMA